MNSLFFILSPVHGEPPSALVDTIYQTLCYLVRIIAYGFQLSEFLPIMLAVSVISVGSLLSQFKTILEIIKLIKDIFPASKRRIQKARKSKQ